MNDASNNEGPRFDAKAWRNDLLRLNRWLKGVKRDDKDAEFREARKKACIERHKEGRVAWNAWAEAMLASRSEIERAGVWGSEEEGARSSEKENFELQRLWLAAARADFSGHGFGEETDFSGFMFPLHAHFDGARFSGGVSFSDAQFSGRAIFNRAQFPVSAIFHTARFSGDASFEGAEFSGEAAFGDARFSGNTSFVRTMFIEAGRFDNAKFSGNAGFRQAQFAGEAEFIRTQFSGVAYFYKARFSGHAGFDQAQFSRNAVFRDAKFEGITYFSEAQFSGKTEFQEAKFSGNAGFREAQFSGHASFAQANFEGATSFDNADFAKDAGFGAVRGETAFSLAGAHFRQVPDFIQAHFEEAPRLDFVTLDPKVEPGSLWRSMLRVFTPDVEEARDLSARYRALKRLAIQGHDHEREQMFFKGELRARRGGEDRVLSWRLWFGFFYELLSDFGGSVIRPLLWWGAATGGFAWLYLEKHFAAHNPAYPVGVAGWLSASLKSWTAAVPGKPPQPDWLVPDLACLAGDQGHPLSAAILLSAKKGLLVLGFVAPEKLNQAYACLYGVVSGDNPAPAIPDAVAFAGIGQTLISAVLIFLMLLAIRNHFRIK
ncbi:MAG: pentapeptide repeat-containing protein [Hyphomicrobiales bacterium]|nr:pentapeptide repeat-containing protein [Hyphomicrobiales bacterium]